MTDRSRSRVQLDEVRRAALFEHEIEAGEAAVAKRTDHGARAALHFRMLDELDHGARSRGSGMRLDFQCGKTSQHLAAPGDDRAHRRAPGHECLSEHSFLERTSITSGKPLNCGFDRAEVFT